MFQFWIENCLIFKQSQLKYKLKKKHELFSQFDTFMGEYVHN